MKVINLDEWRKTVKQHEGNVCRRCGFGSNLHGHHIMPKENYPEFELELDNGIALCGMKCHRLFRPQISKVKTSFFVEIPQESNGFLMLNAGVSGTPFK